MRVKGLLRIGGVAARTGFSVDTIRYYERIGLLPKPQRTPSGYREYAPDVLRRLSVIGNARRFGFSLREVAGFLRVRDAGGRPCHDVRDAAQRALDAVDRQIQELLDLRRKMRRTLLHWDETLASTASHRLARLLETLPEFENAPPRRRIRHLRKRV